MSKRGKRYDYHHRLSQRLGGTDEFPAGNLIGVSKVRHQHWHALFGGHRTLDSIVDELNSVWIDPRFELVLKLREPDLSWVKGDHDET